MPDVRSAPYGSWASPITADLVVAGTVGLSEPMFDGNDVYWLEVRPSEGGRYVVVRRTPDGETIDLTPPEFSARTHVHEYGGGPYVVDRGTVFFSNDEDQRLYRQPAGGEPEPITPEGAFRYADGVVDAERGRLVCVREDHTGSDREAVNTVCSVPVDGDGEPEVLASGHDFFSTPRLSPDGSALAWLAWDHPRMPWDGTELYVAAVRPDGSLGEPRRVAGGPSESVLDPAWSPDGLLHFVSDRSNWWNLYRERDGAIEPLCEMPAEFAAPQWVFRRPMYAFAGPGRLVCAFTQNAEWQLAELDTESRALRRIDTPFTDISYVAAAGGRALFRGGSPTEPASIIRLDLDSGATEALRASTGQPVDAGYLSRPEPIEFPTEGERTAHALFYPPTNADFEGLPGERPPLLVKIHGGPTAAASSDLNLALQFWTSRGFAVVDVNYGGSTGYGREYRERLKSRWGVVDVDDCEYAARYLSVRGSVDPDRLAIRGGSAGGYTTLCALTFRDVFKAGASYYGVSDAEALAKETHKFESRYLDGLIAPYPEGRELYRQRSPIHSVETLDCPLILFQGLEDKIVPPNQAEAVFEALKEKGIPVAYLPFEGEQHGFRRAENIKRTLEAELYFYSRVFEFEPADAIEPVDIANL